MNLTLYYLSTSLISTSSLLQIPTSYDNSATFNFHKIWVSNFVNNFYSSFSSSNIYATFTKSNFRRFLTSPISIDSLQYYVNENFIGTNSFTEIVYIFDTCTFKECKKINGNEYLYGGAIFINHLSSNITIHGTTFDECFAKGDGGAIFACGVLKHTNFQDKEYQHENMIIFNSHYCCYSKCSAQSAEGGDKVVFSGFGSAMLVAAAKTELNYSACIDCPNNDDNVVSYGAQFDIHTENIKSCFINATSGNSYCCGSIEYRQASTGFYRYQTIANQRCAFATSFTSIQGPVNISLCNMINNTLRFISKAPSLALIYVRYKSVKISDFVIVQTKLDSSSNGKTVGLVTKDTGTGDFVVTLIDCKIDNVIGDKKYLNYVVTGGNIDVSEDHMIHHIPLLFLGNCKGEVVPPPYVVTTVFSESAYFSKSDDFTKSRTFSQSSSFSQSKKFSSSSSFSKSNHFTSSNKFSSSSSFSKSNSFSASKKFTSSSSFSKSNSFTFSDKFSLSSSFSSSNKFSLSSSFSLSSQFSKSDTFSKSHAFSNSKKFSSSFYFTGSGIFSRTDDFSKTTEFTKTGLFSMSGNFTKSSPFSQSLEFNHSHSFTPSNTFSASSFFSESHQFSDSCHFTLSLQFSNTQFFSGSREFSNSGHFTDSFYFSFSNQFSYSKEFSSSKAFTASNDFNATHTFTPSQPFTVSNIFNDSSHFTSSFYFTFSSQFTKTHTFTSSHSFTASNNFSETLHFTSSDRFTKSNCFTKSSPFTKSDIFTLSNRFDATNTFTSSLIFTSSGIFSPSNTIRDTVAISINHRNSSNKWKIAGGVIAAAVAAVALIAVIVGFILMRHRRHEQGSDMFEELNPIDSNTSSITYNNVLHGLALEDDPFEDDFHDHY